MSATTEDPITTKTEECITKIHTDFERILRALCALSGTQMKVAFLRRTHDEYVYELSVYESKFNETLQHNSQRLANGVIDEHRHSTSETSLLGMFDREVQSLMEKWNHYTESFDV